MAALIRTEVMPSVPAQSTHLSRCIRNPCIDLECLEPVQYLDVTLDAGIRSSIATVIIQGHCPCSSVGDHYRGVTSRPGSGNHVHSRFKTIGVYSPSNRPSSVNLKGLSSLPPAVSASSLVRCTLFHLAPRHHGTSSLLVFHRRDMCDNLTSEARRFSILPTRYQDQISADG
jgi:hypothetical protein